MATKTYEQAVVLRNLWGGNMAQSALTDDAIKKMPLAELVKISSCKHGVHTELYRRTDDKKTAEVQGGNAGETYVGICRAQIELLERQKKMADADLLLDQEPDTRKGWIFAMKAALEKTTPEKMHSFAKGIIDRYSIAPQEVGLSVNFWEEVSNIV